MIFILNPTFKVTFSPKVDIRFRILVEYFKYTFHKLFLICLCPVFEIDFKFIIPIDNNSLCCLHQTNKTIVDVV